MIDDVMSAPPRRSAAVSRLSLLPTAIFPPSSTSFFFLRSFLFVASRGSIILRELNIAPQAHNPRGSLFPSPSFSLGLCFLLLYLPPPSSFAAAPLLVSSLLISPFLSLSLSFSVPLCLDNNRCPSLPLAALFRSATSRNTGFTRIFASFLPLQLLAETRFLRDPRNREMSRSCELYRQGVLTDGRWPTLSLSLSSSSLNFSSLRSFPRRAR